MRESLSDPVVFRKGMEHVSRADPVMERLVKRHGRLEFRAGGMVFKSLVESILSQQLSGRSANAIIARVNKLCVPGIVSAKKLREISPARLRRAGVSPQKVACLSDLASKVVAGELDLRGLASAGDEEVVAALDQVRGVGRWTAQMVLMFSLGRTDVLPVDDFGIRKSMQEAYRLRELPRAGAIERIAEPWHPYCSVASLYLWRSRD